MTRRRSRASIKKIDGSIARIDRCGGALIRVGELAAAAAAARRPANPGRETTAKCARVENLRIVLPRRDLGERVGADHEEQLGRAVPVARGDGSASPTCTTATARTQLEIGRAPARPAATASATIAKRWNADALGCGRCGGMLRRNDEQPRELQRVRARRRRGRDDRSESDRTCRRGCRRACSSTTCSRARFPRLRDSGPAPRPRQRDLATCGFEQLGHARAGHAGDPEERQAAASPRAARSAGHARLRRRRASILLAATICGLAASVG